jgi:hypothetical protein
MRLQEIEPMDQEVYIGGEDDLEQWREDLATPTERRAFAQKLEPTGRKDIMVYLQRYGGLFNHQTDYVMVLADVTKQNKVIGVLAMDDVKVTDKISGSKVDTITVSEDYRGQNLSMLMYMLAMSKYGMLLVSGSSQTPGGRKNWIRLSRLPGVEVVGKVVLSKDDERVPRDRMIKIGTDGEFDVYIFVVDPATNQMQSRLKEIKLYSENYRDIDAAMIAVYKG